VNVLDLAYPCRVRDQRTGAVQPSPSTRVLAAGGKDIWLFGSDRGVAREDLIFSLVVDQENRLWVGTLGGGIRRLEAGTETLHLTQREGLRSNLILSLATGPEATLWAATPSGVTRRQDVNGTVTSTTFTALDGLGTPVRDVAVDGTGTVWVATDRGLFRIVERGGMVQGVVLDRAGHARPTSCGPGSRPAIKR
jgi:hypothetical protein